MEYTLSMTPESLQNFTVEGENLAVQFVERSQVTAGVWCSVYAFENDTTRDLALVRVEPGARTPRQKVVAGDQTIEGYVSGTGVLIITAPSGTQTIHTVDETTPDFAVTVQVGEVMQWQADSEEELVFYELCYPPFAEGRFENLEE